VIEIDSCTQKVDIEKELFQCEGALMPTDLQFFDIPLLFQDSLEGRAFVNALEKHKN